MFIELVKDNQSHSLQIWVVSKEEHGSDFSQKKKTWQ